MNDVLLRARDVGKLLGVSEQMVRNLAAAGTLTCVRFLAKHGKVKDGKVKDRWTLRFHPDDVKAFVSKHRAGGVD